MSVWRRLQRVGKKAAKFQFTISLHELYIECNPQYKPGDFVIVWSRHNRRYSSKSFQCTQSTENSNAYVHVWTMPENLEFTTTLYRGAKALQFEEKEWVCQLEDVGKNGTVRLSGPSVRRRVLSTRQVELSEFAASLPTQTSMKINMRLASKKLRSANLLLTLHSVILKEGEATDEDMISVASLMSLSRTGSFNVGSGLTINDVGGIGAFSPSTLRYSSFRCLSEKNSTDGGSFHQNLTELTAKLKALEQAEDKAERERNGSEPSEETADSSPVTDCVEPRKAVLESNTGDYSTFSSSNPAHQSTVSLPSMAEPMSADRKAEFGSKPTSTRIGQELLLWCQEVTQSYPAVHITDLTTSFQNGMAFCAILHHFYPEKIDFDKVQNSTPLENCRLAFEVASKLGIPRVLDPSEVTSQTRPPDLLSVMTYLHQIRIRCSAHTDTDKSTPNEQITNAPRAKSVLTRRLSSSSELSSTSSNRGSACFTPTKRLSCSGSMEESAHPAADIRSNVFSRTKDASSIHFEHMLAKARVLLQQTRSSSQADSLPPLARSSKPRPLSSASLAAFGDHKQVTDTTESRGRNGVVKEGAKQHSSTKRRKQRPKALLHFNSDGTISSPNETPQPGSISPSRNGCSPLTTRDASDDLTGLTDGVTVKHLKLSQLNLFASGKGTSAPSPVRIGEHRFDPTKSELHSTTTSQSQTSLPNGTPYRYAVADYTSPRTKASGDPQLTYLQKECDELDRAQRELDKEAAQLEQRLRVQMTRSPGSAAEEQLLQRWFVLVNRKNALIYREHQLSIMEREDELKKETQTIQEELRQIMTMEDFLKTDNDRRREETLLRKLVKLIEERDEMVKELDRHEQALAEELKFERTAIARTRFASRDRLDRCVLQ